MSLLDGLVPPPPRPLPECTSCGERFDFDRAILVAELEYQQAGNCPACCTALVRSSAT